MTDAPRPAWTPRQLAEIVERRIVNNPLPFVDRVMASLTYPPSLREAGLTVAVGEGIAELLQQAIVAAAQETIRVLAALPNERAPGPEDRS